MFFFFFYFVGEIALLEGLTVVYKSNIDLFFYVIGSSHENEVGDLHIFFIILLFCCICYFHHFDTYIREKKCSVLSNFLGKRRTYSLITFILSINF